MALAVGVVRVPGSLSDVFRRLLLLHDIAFKAGVFQPCSFISFFETRFSFLGLFLTSFSIFTTEYFIDR